MRIILISALCLGVASVVMGFNMEEFDRLIGEPCLNRLYGGSSQINRMNLLGRTMESFISLVETIERNHTNWNIHQVAKILIKRFGYDGITLKRVSGKIQAQQDKHYQHRRQIIDKLINFNIEERFEERDLHEYEKCSMFFMMGHLVNNTVYNEEESYVYSANSNNNNPTEQEQKTLAKYPREQGVVSLAGNEHHAIALGKVLLGIVATETETQRTVGEMFPDIDKNKFSAAVPKMVDALFGVTIGDAVAHALLMKGESSNPYGSGGRWNSSVCSSNYILHEKMPGTTLAVLRGAIDGLLIGTALRELRGSTIDLTLSKVLRMYYDPRGIVVQNAGSPKTYCRRAEFKTIDGEKQQVSIQGFYHAYYFLDQGGARFDTEGDNSILNLWSEVDRFNFDDPLCNQPREDKCETLSDVFIVLEAEERANGDRDFQEKVISKLGTKLDIGLGAGSLSVFYNSRDSDLQRIAYNSTNPVFPSCVISWRENPRVSQDADEERLLKSLNDTLRNFENVNSEEIYANSKAVVIFKYGELKTTEQYKITNAAQMVRIGHRDTRVIGVGSNADNLQLMTTSNEDVMTGFTDPSVLADRLADKICKVPSVFQYEKCWDYRSRNEGVRAYEGFVSPDYTQYWAMYPQYFLKSHNIEFKFKIEGLNGDVRVCFSRVNPNPKEGDTKDRYVQCQTTKPEATEIKFYMNDPCHRYDVNTCPPAYFSVTALPSQNFNARCNDKRCRRTDLIKFSFTHTGVSCNGCLQLLNSPYTLFILMAAALYRLYKES